MTIEDAFRRAAKVSPQFAELQLYVQAKSEVTGRPVARTFEHSESVAGNVRWLDFDEYSRMNGGEVGDGIAAIVAPSGPVPDLIQTVEGAWLAVKGAEGRDALGATVRLRVRRWTGTAPVIVDEQP